MLEFNFGRKLRLKLSDEMGIFIEIMIIATHFVIKLITFIKTFWYIYNGNIIKTE